MARAKSHPTTAPKNKRGAFFAPVRLRVADLKVRKPSAPPTKVHQSKKAYRRGKYPTQGEE